MFCLHTLPWYWKALILVYDVFKCWQQDASTTKSVRDVYESTIHVFVFQVLVSLVLVGPSLVLSVQDRKNTNAFVSEMVLLLSTYMLLIRGIGTGVVSAENACFCLQFCSCYFFFCHFICISKNRHLLLGKTICQLTHGLIALLRALSEKIDGEPVFDTGATNLFIVVPTLTVPDRWIFPRIEGG
jgi:glycerol uptake facilitator-like aquaporin